MLTLIHFPALTKLAEKTALRDLGKNSNLKHPRPPVSEMPAHLLPTYSDAAREEALFHYTNASGLIGILRSGQIWATAYYCANDESELAAGKGVLTPLFRNATYKLIEANDPRVLKFGGRGVDILEYADQFERQITGIALSSLCAYITCFCKPAGEEDFHHGLLSQWK